MPLHDCRTCARLWASYRDAEAKLARAEAELGKAKISRNQERIRAARKAEQGAQAHWRVTDQAVQEHRRSHFMTAGSGSVDYS